MPVGWQVEIAPRHLGSPARSEEVGLFLTIKHRALRVTIQGELNHSLTLGEPGAS